MLGRSTRSSRAQASARNSSIEERGGAYAPDIWTRITFADSIACEIAATLVSCVATRSSKSVCVRKESGGPAAAARRSNGQKFARKVGIELASAGNSATTTEGQFARNSAASIGSPVTKMK